MKVLIGQKIGMTQMLSDDGKATAMTLIKVDPCIVTQVKTDETDGHSAVQLGTGVAKKLSKPQVGHAKPAKINPAVVKEVRVDEKEEVAVGDSFDVTAFETGDVVKVTGVSKGKGFAGTIKRHNFLAGPKSHGSKNIRRPGSIGSMYPQKVFRGKKMAGHMGSDQVTTKNLSVILVDADKHVIGIKGAVPGAKKTQILVQGIAQ